MDYILTTNSLTKIYGKHKAADHISINVRQGDIYGLIGRNGAGKTTLLKMISGLAAPSEGDFSLFGYKGKEKAKVMHRIGTLIEAPGIYPDLSAYENLKLKCIAMGVRDMQVIPKLLKTVGLADTGKKRVGKFSLGMKQRLGIALALIGEPDLVILDEPINGLDPQGIIEIRELILRLNRERQITVLISSHILDELSRLATHYGIIDSGRMVKELSAEELEAACRKCMRMTVSDTKILARVLDSMEVEYKILSDTQADVFAKVNVTELTLALAKEGCEVSEIQERDESLESFYISLVGGGRND